MDSLSEMIKKDIECFSLEEIKNDENYRRVKKELTSKISKMISENFGGFLNELYRIDVSELKLKQAIANAQPDEVPAIVADMVIERTIQKMIYRKKYSES